MDYGAVTPVVAYPQTAGSLDGVDAYFAFRTSNAWYYTKWVNGGSSVEVRILPQILHTQCMEAASVHLVSHTHDYMSGVQRL